MDSDLGIDMMLKGVVWTPSFIDHRCFPLLLQLPDSWVSGGPGGPRCFCILARANGAGRHVDLSDGGERQERDEIRLKRAVLRNR